MGGADCIHFVVFGMRCERAVEAASRSGGSRYLLFLWNNLPGGVLGPDTHISLVSDESDKFALPDSDRLDAWKVRAEHAFNEAIDYREAPSMPDTARRLFGHCCVFRVDS